jgi:hypothetical protein
MSAGRSVRRRRLRQALPAGLGGLACVACCTVPLWVAGGLTISSGALALDACRDSWLPAILIAGTIIGTTVLLTRGSWRRRRHARKRKAQACGYEPTPATEDLPRSSLSHRTS